MMFGTVTRHLGEAMFSVPPVKFHTRCGVHAAQQHLGLGHV